MKYQERQEIIQKLQLITSKAINKWNFVNPKMDLIPYLEARLKVVEEQYNTLVHEVLGFTEELIKELKNDEI